MSVQFWVNRALVARWIHTTVAAGVVALLVHVSDTDEPWPNSAASLLGAAGTVRVRGGEEDGHGV